jgi:hypothetical protein
MTTRTYTVFGLALASELALPELPAATESPRISLRLGSVPRQLDGTTLRGARYQVSEEAFLLWVDGVARYMVAGGDRVVIDSEPGAPLDEVRLYLLGPVLGALLHQRGILPVRGAALEVGGRAVLLLGGPGSGKSTLLAALCERGYRALSDDIVAIECPVDADPIVLPGYPSIGLWRDALGHLDTSAWSFRPIRTGVQKYRASVGRQFCPDARPLGCAYVVSTTNADAITIESMSSLDAMAAMLENTYRTFFLEGMTEAGSHFDSCAGVGTTTRFRTLYRPVSSFQLGPLADSVEQDLRG